MSTMERYAKKATTSFHDMLLGKKQLVIKTPGSSVAGDGATGGDAPATSSANDADLRDHNESGVDRGAVYRLMERYEREYGEHHVARQWSAQRRQTFESLMDAVDTQRHFARRAKARANARSTASLASAVSKASQVETRSELSKLPFSSGIDMPGVDIALAEAAAQARRTMVMAAIPPTPVTRRSVTIAPTSRRGSVDVHRVSPRGGTRRGGPHPLQRTSVSWKTTRELGASKAGDSRSPSPGVSEWNRNSDGRRSRASRPPSSMGDGTSVGTRGGNAGIVEKTVEAMRAQTPSQVATFFMYMQARLKTVRQAAETRAKQAAAKAARDAASDNTVGDDDGQYSRAGSVASASRRDVSPLRPRPPTGAPQLRTHRRSRSRSRLAAAAAAAGGGNHAPAPIYSRRPRGGY